MSSKVCFSTHPDLGVNSVHSGENAWLDTISEVLLKSSSYNILALIVYILRTKYINKFSSFQGLEYALFKKTLI